MDPSHPFTVNDLALLTKTLTIQQTTDFTSKSHFLLIRVYHAAYKDEIGYKVAEKQFKIDVIDYCVPTSID